MGVIRPSRRVAVVALLADVGAGRRRKRQLRGGGGGSAATAGNGSAGNASWGWLQARATEGREC